MKIAVDTNVLARAILDDDPHQGEMAREALARAEVIALSIVVLCELVWVLRRGYGKTTREVSILIQTLLEIDRIVVDRPAVEAGLAMLDGGGDFADGVIQHTGQWLGGDTFLSFDRDAVRRLSEQGHRAEIPGGG
ncbi:type II toxin-antitoxin system VapC family toxin [Phenylobacterium sp.]|uniref:type II toxin-antitoxin system VapC family toxin n=1 Tax=Phenylobacterium sp. TaxID=1871053 RepID=UPI00301DB4A9